MGFHPTLCLQPHGLLDLHHDQWPITSMPFGSCHISLQGNDPKRNDPRKARSGNFGALRVWCVGSPDEVVLIVLNAIQAHQTIPSALLPAAYDWAFMHTWLLKDDPPTARCGSAGRPGFGLPVFLQPCPAGCPPRWGPRWHSPPPACSGQMQPLHALWGAWPSPVPAAQCLHRKCM